MYLKLFKELGLNVTFLGADFKNPEPYTTILQKEGINVLYGDFYRNNITNWFKINLKNFQYVYLQRPEIAQDYLDIIRNYSSGKIFYFGHDLHHIRLLREFNITHNNKAKQQSEIMKKIEFEIFSKVDVIHVVGNYEQKILKEQFNEKPIRNIPIFIYGQNLINIEKDFSKRKDLIFVGGFSHLPNVDAINWFHEYVFPKIIETFPDIVLHIAGSNIPIKIRNLQSKNIIIEGYLTEKNLSSLYEKCRISIAPIRFGAGVKGKIIEAAFNQIPMVTTTIGAEGLDHSMEVFLIEDDAEKMAKSICELYINFSKLKKMSDSGAIFIEKYFSMKKAKEEIMKDLNC